MGHDPGEDDFGEEPVKLAETYKMGDEFTWQGCFKSVAMVNMNTKDRNHTQWHFKSFRYMHVICYFLDAFDLDQDDAMLEDDNNHSENRL